MFFQWLTPVELRLSKVPLTQFEDVSVIVDALERRVGV